MFPRQDEQAPALRFNSMDPVGFGVGPVASFFLPVFPFRMGTPVLRPAHCCIFKDKFRCSLLDFTGSWLEGRLPQGGACLESRRCLTPVRPRDVAVDLKVVVRVREASGLLE